MKFSAQRLISIIYKEFIQMRRDKLTFAMIVLMPLLQLILFGFAINTNPKNLPTAVVQGDHSPIIRQFIQGMVNTHYFKIIATPDSYAEADQLLSQGKVLFIVTIPADFTRNTVRGLKPQILIEADGTDSIAVANALSTIPELSKTVFTPLLEGPLRHLQEPQAAVEIINHIKYNPENITAYNVVPGLLGVILTMTMVIITSQAIIKEHERGTMEQLLSTPVKPLEVMVGKIIPYILIGYIQVALVLLFSLFLFQIPFYGSIILLLLCSLPFLAANLGIGLTFSSLANNQLQAVQLAFFFFLPSILLSGFMFPFYGMPEWAQVAGSVLPLTYFIRVVRGIIIKGNGFSEIWPNLWPIMLIFIVTLFVGIKKYRRTLD